MLQPHEGSSETVGTAKDCRCLWLQPHEGSSETLNIRKIVIGKRLQPHEGSSETGGETIYAAVENVLQPHEGSSETFRPDDWRTCISASTPRGFV